MAKPAITSFDLPVPGQPLLQEPERVDWPESTRPGDLRSLAGERLSEPADGRSAVSVLAGGAGSAFDVCHVGVVLRAVLFVQAVVGVGVLFSSATLADWLQQLAFGVSMAMPGVLLWLVSACLLKRVLARLPAKAQWAAALGLGALSGAFGHGLLTAGDAHLSAANVPWLAPAATGASLAAALFYWLALRARARMPADTAARLAELQSRIRPHFLFNTLNSAIALARLDPARAEGLLEDLAELFRVALSDHRASVNLADEVALAQRYLAIEQVRFGERLQVSWELDAAAGAARVPPLLLQPLVENAVRHGVESSPTGGVIRIRTRVRRAHAVISIANTVPPGPSRPGNGMALRNVRERLKLMHDVAAQFDVQSDGRLFRVQMVVPL